MLCPSVCPGSRTQDTVSHLTAVESQGPYLSMPAREWRLLRGLGTLCAINNAHVVARVPLLGMARREGRALVRGRGSVPQDTGKRGFLKQPPKWGPAPFPERNMPRPALPLEPLMGTMLSDGGASDREVGRTLSLRGTTSTGLPVTLTGRDTQAGWWWQGMSPQSLPGNLCCPQSWD